MNKLERIAKRIGEIGDEIAQRKSQRETNLAHCGASDDTDFGSQREIIDHRWNIKENCLNVAYKWAKEEREQCESDCEPYNTESFYEILRSEGCLNCIGAYEEKRKIGSLKQERGRLVGNISKIGKSL